MMGAFLRRFLRLFRRRRLDREIEDELAFHLAMADQEPSRARRFRHRLVLVREQTADIWRFGWIENARQDVRIAARTLLKYPTSSLIAVLSLAGGIGITAATLTILNAIFFRPPPLYERPDELTRVTISSPEDRRGGVPGGLYDVWRRDPMLAGTIAAATASRPGDLRTLATRASSRVRRVSPELFDLLGVQPDRGRSFAASDQADISPVIISHRVWQTVFSGEQSAVGSSLWIDDRPHTVIGVMPERFWFRSMDSEVWVPLSETEVFSGAGSLASATRLEVIVRRRNVGQDALADHLQRSVPIFTATLPPPDRHVRTLVQAVRGTPDGEGVGWLIPPLIVTAVLLTLLIACVNVAILMFARWTTREREMGIRSSLGGSRRRIVSMLLTESTLLAVAGGALGVWAALTLRDLTVRNVASARYFNTSIDTGFLLQCVVISVLAGLLSGLVPALLETRRLFVNPLRSIAASERVRQRWRHALVSLEIAVTVALLVGVAGQLDAYRRMLTDDMGFETEPLALAQIEHPESVDQPRILDRLRATPGVASVAASTDMPLAEGAVRRRVSGDTAATNLVLANGAFITPDFFTVLGVPILAGRTFEARDVSDTSGVAIVNEPLARLLWASQSPIGSQLWIDKVPYAVVGVVKSYRMYPLAPPFPSFYLPMADATAARPRLRTLLRATGSPSALIGTVRQEINSLGDGHVVTRTVALRQALEVGGQEILALTYALSPLLLMALFLTATGTFGVLAFAVSRRARELALRVAIGAGPYDLFRLIASHSVVLTLAGASAGVVLMLGLTGLVRALGGAESALDTRSWVVFVAPVLVVSVVVALATWLPARRALTIDPAQLLRAD